MSQIAARMPLPSIGAWNLGVIARKELREALSSKWFLLYTIAFIALSALLSFVTLAGAGAYGFAGFGQTAAGLLNLIMLIVPLMALTSGAGAIAGERERGTLVYLLAQPVSRAEILLGKAVGLSLALLASLALGFGCSALLLAWKSGGAGAGAFVTLAGYTALLALAMLAVGLLISSLTRRGAVAIGIAVFVWLILVFVSDLGLMAGAIVFKLRVEELFAIAIINPLQAYKMGVMQHLSPTLDVLGPAGMYASSTFGHWLGALLLGVLVAWIVVPLGLSMLFFSRSSPL